jgi:hypothetical protein
MRDTFTKFRSITIDLVQGSKASSYVSIGKEQADGTIIGKCYFLDKISSHSLLRVRKLQDAFIIRAIKMET